MNKKYSVVSLFAGAGGLDMGFENQGFHVIWANDIDKDACETHRLWSDAEVFHGDIKTVDFNKIPSADVITGGFPCQGFSLAGPRKIDDKRNALYKYFVSLVDIKQPYAFVAENVKGILTLGDGTIIEAIIEDFSLRGYHVFPSLVNAADYGVPQDRWRVIMIGFRKDLGINKFEFTKPSDRKVTLSDALNKIPPPDISDVCQGAYSSRYMSRNRKREWNNVSYTIPAMSKQVPLHPSSPDMNKTGEDQWKFGHNGLTRRFSWQEAAAIQTFPDGMVFSGNLTSKYKQIGNAVPVKLAEVAANQVYTILEDYLLSKNNGKAYNKAATQTQKGKAFEYSCLKILNDILSKNQEIVIDETLAYKTAKEFYENLDENSVGKMDKAAKAAVKVLLRLEPLLENPDDNTPLLLHIQDDSKGITGDVRDVICLRKQIGWEIGLSCKHNHTAVKHSRLSYTIDFGKMWFNKKCSEGYFIEIEPIFSKLNEQRDRSLKWSQILHKDDSVYVPLLDAFIKELKRLDQEYPGEIPSQLIKYLLGRNDFYKVITQDSKELTTVQAYNLFGALNKPSNKVKPMVKVLPLRLPARFYDISYKENSKNTVIVTCDGGWALSFRIHNASTNIEPSLKFDVQLIGVPQGLHTQLEPWEESQ